MSTSDVAEGLDLTLMADDPFALGAELSTFLVVRLAGAEDCCAGDFDWAFDSATFPAPDAWLVRDGYGTMVVRGEMDILGYAPEEPWTTECV